MPLQSISYRGYVYLIKAIDHPWWKIGMSVRLEKRIQNLGVLMPFATKVVAVWRTNDPADAERMLHEQYADLRLGGEWFDFAESKTAKTALRVLLEEPILDFGRVLMERCEQEFGNSIRSRQRIVLTAKKQFYRDMWSREIGVLKELYRDDEDGLRKAKKELRAKITGRRLPHRAWKPVDIEPFHASHLLHVA